MKEEEQENENIVSGKELAELTNKTIGLLKKRLDKLSAQEDLTDKESVFVANTFGMFMKMWSYEQRFGPDKSNDELLERLERLPPKIKETVMTALGMEQSRDKEEENE